MVNKERILNEFLKYVQIDSETKNEKEFANFILNELKDLGLEVEMDDAGSKVGSNAGNVIAKLSGTKKVQPILFSCHMDTVSPGNGIKPIIKDDVIYSDGTTILGGDNKAGIAAIVEALRVIKENNIEHGPLEIVFSIFEEGGLFGSKNLDYSKLDSKIAFVLDSGGEPGQIIVKGPAQDAITVTVKGIPAHAGVCPEEGVSAIQVAAHAISNMKLLRIDEETTANIGKIVADGPNNIVSPIVEIKAEARSLNKEKLDAQTNHMRKCFEDAGKKFGAEIEFEATRMYQPFNVSESENVVEIAKTACKNLNLPMVLQGTGGGSDTNVLNANGLKAVNLGIGERKAHTLEEHLHIKDLVSASKLVLEIIKTV
ncbi:M20/M25/M40 family metallo-hydrolase [Clostridium senegalense]|uniref:M20/M25/M40 family metallo-hydrolase n=1 Tax=Clostridium senegalense TaxID=1465809 RepID=UPI00028968A4|nr:M20/M25/M40 family metallo-hydrolase [Clostridium senegalense]MBU5227479.1 M20/M25/M40 family metallo-hydrolase [Clostridium senegalense]